MPPKRNARAQALSSCLPHSIVCPAIVIVSFSVALIAPPWQFLTHSMQRSQMWPSKIGSGSSSASVSMSAKRWRGPNSGVRNTRDQPNSPRPARYAATRKSGDTSGYGRPGRTGRLQPLRKFPVTGFTASPPFTFAIGTASYPWSSMNCVRLHSTIGP